MVPAYAINKYIFIFCNNFSSQYVDSKKTEGFFSQSGVSSENGIHLNMIRLANFVSILRIGDVRRSVKMPTRDFPANGDSVAGGRAISSAEASPDR